MVRSVFFRRFHRIEGTRAQGSVERRPARRHMAMIEMRRRTEKAFTADFALIGSAWQVRMRLARRFTFDMRKLDPVFRAHACSTPRLI